MNKSESAPAGQTGRRAPEKARGTAQSAEPSTKDHESGGAATAQKRAHEHPKANAQGNERADEMKSA